MVAWVQIGKTIIWGSNNTRNNRKFNRIFPNGEANCAHAEMDAAQRAITISPNKQHKNLHVMRFLKNGDPAMAKPCIHCQKFLKDNNFKNVFYTDENGNWQKLKL